MAEFWVIRRCAPGDCEPDCNCDLVQVLVDVDELLPAELAALQVAGSPDQRAEIAAWLSLAAAAAA